MPEFEIPMSLVKAMVVDDHDPIRKAMKRILQSMGVSQIIECFDGSDAIREFSRHSDINLVLCDIYMRKISGFDLLSFIRNRTVGSDIPCLIVTGESNKDDIVKASDLGADDYMVKPFQADVMIQKVKSVLTNFYSPPPLIKLLRKGDSLLLTSHYDEALESYKEAFGLDNSSKRASHAIAVALFYCGQAEQAIQILVENIAKSPSYYRNFASLADIYLKKQNYPLAVEYMKKELEVNPKQAHRQVQLARTLFSLGDTEGAIVHFKEALKLNLKNHQALFGIAKAFAKLEDFEKALYYFLRLRRHFPHENKSLKAIVQLCLKFGKERRAELVLLDEKNRHPDRHDTYLILARFYQATGRLPKARESLAALLKLDAEHKEALFQLGNIELKNLSFSQAEAIFTKAVDSDKNFINLFSLARAQHGLGQHKKAVDSIHSALALAPFEPKAFFLLAQIYFAAGNFLKAQINFTLAVTAGIDKGKCEFAMAQCMANIAQKRRQPLKHSA